VSDPLESAEPRQSRLQPPLPKRYRVRPVVRPLWHVADLVRAGSGPERLREAICHEYGVRHCFLLDRARSGLYLLIDGLGLRGEWISTSFMHRPASVLVKNHVARLALTGIGDDFNIDPDAAGSMASSDTEVLLATHMYGRVADMARLTELARNRGWFLIENAVHLPGGVEVDGRRVGSIGDAAILSFNVDKPAGGILGGALITNRDDVANAIERAGLGRHNTRECLERIRQSFLAYHLKPAILSLPFAARTRAPRDGIADIESFPYRSYRQYQPRAIHPFQAAAAAPQVAAAREVVARRVANAKRLSAAISHLTRVVVPQSSVACPNTYLYYPVILDDELDRFEVGAALAARGIETKWRYHPLHLQEGFEECPVSDMTRTERLWRQHLLLPCTARSTPDEIDRVASALDAVVGQ